MYGKYDYSRNNWSCQKPGCKHNCNCYPPVKDDDDCDNDYPDCCDLPKIKIPCEEKKECIKTFTCVYKLYKTCRYRLYKVCPRCSYEFDHHQHRGVCPKCSGMKMGPM